MADNIKGIVVEIGGNTTGLNKALQSTNKEINSTQKELRDVERLLKLDPTNTELLRQKHELLAKSVQETKTKVDALKAAKEKADADMANGTEVNQEQYRKLQREIVASEESLKKLESQALKSDVALSKISAVSNKIADAAGNIASKTAPASLAIGGLGAVAFNAASEMQDAIGATDQVFKDQSSVMQEWADNLESYYGIAETEALTYANTMGSMLKNIGGLSEEEAAKQSQTLIKLAGDLTAMFGGTTESAVQALTGALKGNNSMLDNYGMAVNDAMIKSKALEMGLITEGQQLDLAGKQAATLALIMEQTADATGQAERESSGASGSLRAIKTELKNVSAELGEALLPLITPLIQKVTEVIKAFAGMSDGQKKAIVTILALVAAISPVAGIVSAVAGIVGTLSSAIAIFTGMATTGSAAAVGLAKVIALLTSPITWVVAAIVAAVALIAIKGDEIQAILAKVNDFVQNIFAADFTNVFGPVLGNALNAFFANVKNIWDSILRVLNGVIDIIRGVFTGDWSRAWQGVIDVFSGIFGGLAAIAKAPINGIIAMLNAAIEGINKLISGLNKINFDIPDWVPGLGGKSFGINIPKIGKIPFLAKGGILSSGSAIVGEAGPELLTMSGGNAVVRPLTGSNGGINVNMNCTFNGYKHSDGVAASRDLMRTINRELGRAF